MSVTSSDLKIKIFADGADVADMTRLCADPLIQGFTTNPTLMRKAGVADYRAFARDALAAIPDHPISFEVFADEFDEMERQAREIGTWGDNVYIKIPITNTLGDSAVPLMRRLSDAGLKVNATAMFTLGQVETVVAALGDGPPAYASVFAGRIADSGRDPVPMMQDALDLLRGAPGIELIWASPREVFDIVRADAIGCHIITVTSDLLAKVALLGKDLEAFSLETVRMFHEDAETAGYSL